MFPVRRFALLSLVLLVTACGGADGGGAVRGADGGETTAAPSPLRASEGFGAADITLSGGGEQLRVPVLVADEPDLRQRGLMERESLPAGAGMLFVFEAPTDGGFWMKNTLIPLSIAFIDDDGRLLEILDMEPCDADPCTVYTPGVTYRYALEVNSGFLDDHGVTTDWTADLDDAL
jgi:hypothetical protein